MAATLSDLLRTIDEDFDTSAHWHPLADFLIEREDPRGELINIDLALEAGDGDNKALIQRRVEILETSAPALLGTTFARVVEDGYGKVTWRRGFVEAVAYRGDPSLRHRKAVGWLLKLMHSTPEVFVFLRRLDLSYTDITDVAPLAAFTHLLEVELTGCEVPLASMNALEDALSELRIIRR